MHYHPPIKAFCFIVKQISWVLYMYAKNSKTLTLLNMYRHLLVINCTAATNLLDIKIVILERNVDQYLNVVWTYLNLNWGETICCCFMMMC